MSELSVLALVPYPLDTTPSQRFRLEQWAPLLARDHGIHVHWSPFADARLFALLARPGRVAAKAARMAWATAARTRELVRARRHDVVIVHRAACLAGPAWLERLLAASGKPLVFDFDDAIWLRHTSGANAVFDSLKFPGKTATLCRIAALVVAGCEYLAAYARRHGQRVAVVPTSIDTRAYAPRPRAARDRVVIGWTGSATSLTHLESFAPVLRSFLAQRPVELRVLSTREPVMPGVPVTYRRWTPENEIEEVAAFDVGIKPMPDDPWSRGKCPMKELQYLALGVPAVCSDVGTAGEAVRPGENGFLARTPDDWIAHLVRLADDAPLRARMGEAGRRTVVERYSAESSARAFAAAVRAAVEVR
jgi:glycosyltransferase involved in cell wall biosynthesis